MVNITPFVDANGETQFVNNSEFQTEKGADAVAHQLGFASFQVMQAVQKATRLKEEPVPAGSPGMVNTTV